MTNRMVRATRTAFIVAATFTLSSCQATSTKLALSADNESVKPPSLSGKRYLGAVQEHLGSIWYRLAEENANRMDMGTVRVTFDMPAVGGKVRNVRVISNTGGQRGLIVALRAIDLLRAPPIPAQYLAELRSDHVNMDMTFTVFPER